MVYYTVTRLDKDFTLLETPNGQTREKRSLCELFNALEKDGFKLVSAGDFDIEPTHFCRRIRLGTRFRLPQRVED
jgi:hypothetical protein